MKYAVHVTTLDEQNYVSMKLYNKILSHKWVFLTNDNDFFDRISCVARNGYEIISFEEFKSRYELKIGDTFEKDGFVCEVKEKVSFWVYNTLISTYHKDVELMEHHILITDQEFINQLEKFAK